MAVNLESDGRARERETTEGGFKESQRQREVDKVSDDLDNMIVSEG